MPQEIVLTLLEAGANPNGVSQRENETLLDRLIKKIEKVSASSVSPLEPLLNYLKSFKLLIRYGGRVNQAADNPKFIELLKEQFPQPLIQAIALRARGQVEKLLAANPPKTKEDIVTDSDGISAIVYAAGQGNEQILSLLLAYQPYQYDTQGLEQAIEIVASRLRGLKPDSAEFNKYKAVFDALKKELGTTWQVLINQLSGYTSATGQSHAPGFPELPSELSEYILKLTSPRAYADIFSHK